MYKPALDVPLAPPPLRTRPFVKEEGRERVRRAAGDGAADRDRKPLECGDAGGVTGICKNPADCLSLHVCRTCVRESMSKWECVCVEGLTSNDADNEEEEDRKRESQTAQAPSSLYLPTLGGTLATNPEHRHRAQRTQPYFAPETRNQKKGNKKRAQNAFAFRTTRKKEKKQLQKQKQRQKQKKKKSRRRRRRRGGGGGGEEEEEEEEEEKEEEEEEEEGRVKSSIASTARRGSSAKPWRYCRQQLRTVGELRDVLVSSFVLRRTC